MLRWARCPSECAAFAPLRPPPSAGYGHNRERDPNRSRSTHGGLRPRTSPNGTAAPPPLKAAYRLRSPSIAPVEAANVPHELERVGARGGSSDQATRRADSSRSYSPRRPSSAATARAPRAGPGHRVPRPVRGAPGLGRGEAASRQRDSPTFEQRPKNRAQESERARRQDRSEPEEDPREQRRRRAVRGHRQRAEVPRAREARREDPGRELGGVDAGVDDHRWPSDDDRGERS